MNSEKTPKPIVEVILVLVTLGLVCLLQTMATHRSVVLNLFYLPVVVAGFCLGRYRAGALALLAVIATSVVVMADLNAFAPSAHPLMLILNLCVWAAVLGLTAMLVGSLSEDRNAKGQDARDARFGVIDILGAYLQSVNPKLRSRSRKVAELSEAIGKQMRLTEAEVDNLRVAAMLVGLEGLEITARVIRKAVGEASEETAGRTVHGSELVRSLGGVLTGAFPIAQSVVQADDWRVRELGHTAPLGAEIVRAARAFEERLANAGHDASLSVDNILAELQTDDSLALSATVLDALRQAILVKPQDARPARTVALQAQGERQSLAVR